MVIDLPRCRRVSSRRRRFNPRTYYFSFGLIDRKAFGSTLYLWLDNTKPRLHKVRFHSSSNYSLKSGENKAPIIHPKQLRLKQDRLVVELAYRAQVLGHLERPVKCVFPSFDYAERTDAAWLIYQPAFRNNNAVPPHLDNFAEHGNKFIKRRYAAGAIGSYKNPHRHTRVTVTSGGARNDRLGKPPLQDRRLQMSSLWLIPFFEAR
jgi:hypothetical protein